MLRTTIISAALSLTAAQDPAGGWMAYAVGTVPAETTRITRMQMTWKVGENPTTSSGAFDSPLFGMDPSDNLNLMQPVNPWLGRGWAMYTEYFQWIPEDNSNSEQNDVEAGQTLQGTLHHSLSLFVEKPSSDQTSHFLSAFDGPQRLAVGHLSEGINRRWQNHACNERDLAGPQAVM